MDLQIISAFIFLVMLQFCGTKELGDTEIIPDTLSGANITSYIEKKSRFLTFNNEDGQIKIELDFSVPFLQIPIGGKRSGATIHPVIDINAKGLVTVGAMVFLFVAIVPKLVQIFIPQAHGGPIDGFGHFMARIDEALQGQDFDSVDCYKKAACWVASNTPLSHPISNILRTSTWVKNLMDDSIQNAIIDGSKGSNCELYNCPLSVQTITKILGTFAHSGHSTKHK